MEEHREWPEGPVPLAPVVLRYFIRLVQHDVQAQEVTGAKVEVALVDQGYTGQQTVLDAANGGVESLGRTRYSLVKSNRLRRIIS